MPKKIQSVDPAPCWALAQMAHAQVNLIVPEEVRAQEEQAIDQVDGYSFDFGYVKAPPALAKH